MGRGKKLSECEIRTVLKLQKEQCSVAQIAKVINRSRKVVMNLLKDPKTYGKKKSSGRPRSLTSRDERAILRAASNSQMTAKQIADSAGVNTNVRNVRRVLQKCKHTERKLLEKPQLNEEHKIKHLQFAEKYVRMKKTWRNVVFIDEKRSNPD